MQAQPKGRPVMVLAVVSTKFRLCSPLAIQFLAFLQFQHLSEIQIQLTGWTVMVLDGVAKFRLCFPLAIHSLSAEVRLVEPRLRSHPS